MDNLAAKPVIQRLTRTPRLDKTLDSRTTSRACTKKLFTCVIHIKNLCDNGQSGS
jgi:hypothetical protein